jgi:hypothetical protein
MTGDRDIESQTRYAKELALICVDEIFKCLPSFANDVSHTLQSNAFWSQVKEELEK